MVTSSLSEISTDQSKELTNRPHPFVHQVSG
jgi:hypothetical protein